MVVQETVRKYLPTVAQLIDRLAIVTLKSVKIPEHKSEYEKEASDIMADLDALCPSCENFGRLVRAIQVNAIANEMIWANEARARAEGAASGEELIFTHSINGIRTAAMNRLSALFGERKDLKVDCLAADAMKMRGYDFREVL
uniref:Uncharacterized protein n=1 Tax=viral metagenome TaxID=1070528 RepID=A0A6H1ZGF8_9ZZZZ